MRSGVQMLLQWAAVGMEVPPETLGSHSLRTGGAPASWACHRDGALVKRRGRWASEALQGGRWGFVLCMIDRGPQVLAMPPCAEEPRCDEWCRRRSARCQRICGKLLPHSGGHACQGCMPPPLPPGVGAASLGAVQPVLRPRYLWEARDAPRGISEVMATVNLGLG